jgi:transposase
VPANIEIPLDLPEIRIVKTEMGQQEIVITVESTREWAICPRCRGETREFHSYRRLLRLRHLSILGRPLIIEIRPKLFRCPTCEDHPTITQKLDWYDELSPHNTSAVKHVLPGVRIVVDRFHVAKAYRDGADQLRKEVQRELKASLEKDEVEADTVRSPVILEGTIGSPPKRRCHRL